MVKTWCSEEDLAAQLGFCLDLLLVELTSAEWIHI